MPRPATPRWQAETPARGASHTVGKGNSLVHCERSDVGRRRSNNQDSFAYLPPSSPAQYRQRGWLFLVADGMGAHAAGERASAIAAERVPLLYEKTAHHSPPLALKRSIEAVNGEIHASGESTPDCHGMGTTCTVMAILPRGALVGHVGDSRAYRVRGTKIEQLTQDHSLVWELESKMPAGHEHAASPSWPPKNIITRSMGPNASVTADLEGPFPVEEGDIFILASDGLSGQVADDEIGLLASQLDLRDAAEALVGLTLVRGAPDNVTLIMVQAGPQEVSQVAPGDAPWVMADPQGEEVSKQTFPWKPLVLAGVCLFAALASYSLSLQVEQENYLKRMLDPSLVDAVSMIAAAAFGGLSIILVLWSFLQGLGSSETTPQPLLPGMRLGKGPYRTYDCGPTAPLFDGIVKSIEAASDELAPPAQEAAEGLLADAKRLASEGHHQDALAAVKKALDIHVRAIRS